MSGGDERWALALHGGAGVRPGRDYGRAERVLAELVARGETDLSRGAAALDVVVELVAAMEEAGVFVAGRGSGPNRLGQVELDASVMDGTGQRCGAVAALQGVSSAVRAAAAVMERSPHVLLVGAGASRFALDAGLAPIADLDVWLRTPDGFDDSDREGSHGTVGAVARDRQGRLAAATSTGGIYKALPGRVGDSAVIGAGTWADDGVAVSCTGEGEAFIRACAAHAYAAATAAGVDPDAAATAVLKAVAARGGEGGLIAVNREAELTFAYSSPGMKRAGASWCRPAEVGVLDVLRRLNESPREGMPADDRWPG